MGKEIEIAKEDVKMFKLNSTKISDETISQMNQLRSEMLKETSSI
jgi:hypothetical protein